MSSWGSLLAGSLIGLVPSGDTWGSGSSCVLAISLGGGALLKSFPFKSAALVFNIQHPGALCHVMILLHGSWGAALTAHRFFSPQWINQVSGVNSYRRDGHICSRKHQTATFTSSEKPEILFVINSYHVSTSLLLATLKVISSANNDNSSLRIIFKER